MSCLEIEFDATMAGIAAPPISLQEFRLFVEHDPVARNALAFCEWYQRYKTVYFDRDFVAPTILTSTSSRPGIPSDFIPSVRKRTHAYTCANLCQNDQAASLSVPNTADHWRSEAIRGKMLSLKSHSYSVLSEGMIESAFRTFSTGANDSLANKHLNSQKALGTMKFLSQDNLQNESCTWPAKARSVGRRHTLHAPDGLYEPNVINVEQEQHRAAVQSLLIFECWARFLCAGARERIAIPEAELMYLTERLPLNITHLSQPLLCRDDMLVSHDFAAAESSMPPTAYIAKKDPTASVATQSCCPDLYKTTRISCSSAKHNYKRFVDVEHIRKLHHTLRPRPVFSSHNIGSVASQQPFGYNPVPQHISNLIIPSNIPPALFETTSKISSDLLFQRYFADFYYRAHYNVTTREQKIFFMLAGIFATLAVGTAVTLATVSINRAWRTFVLPVLCTSLMLLCAAWTRVSIWRWWHCKRPTSLLNRHTIRDYEESLSGCCPNTELNSIRQITGTLNPLPSAAIVGTLYCLGYPSRHLKWHHLPCAHNEVEDAKGTSSSATLWSYMSYDCVGRGICGKVVRFMLRKHQVGDQWFIDLESLWMRVLDPSVLNGQCRTIFHQLAIQALLCSVFSAVLFLVA